MKLGEMIRQCAGRSGFDDRAPLQCLSSDYVQIGCEVYAGSCLISICGVSVVVDLYRCSVLLHIRQSYILKTHVHGKVLFSSPNVE
jgi:hypothetical protein